MIRALIIAALSLSLTACYDSDRCLPVPDHRSERGQIDALVGSDIPPELQDARKLQDDVNDMIRAVNKDRGC